MEYAKITIDPTLLTYVVQALGRVPESLYDLQKIRNLSCGGRPVCQELTDPLKDALPERLEIVRGDFSVIGKMSRLKKLAISAMTVKDFSFLTTLTIDFLAGNIDDIRGKDVQWRRAFAIAATAILGEGKLAYMLSLSGFISYYVVCSECENCDEEMEVGYFELSERMKKAKAPSGKWDGRSLEDVRLWLPNLFRLLEDEEGEELLSYYFGTYVCPECGEEMPVLAGMEEYYLAE